VGRVERVVTVVLVVVVGLGVRLPGKVVVVVVLTVRLLAVVVGVVVVVRVVRVVRVVIVAREVRPVVGLVVSLVIVGCSVLMIVKWTPVTAPVALGGLVVAPGEVGRVVVRAVVGREPVGLCGKVPAQTRSAQQRTTACCVRRKQADVPERPSP
jgi:hypothetical protein